MRWHVALILRRYQKRWTKVSQQENSQIICIYRKNKLFLLHVLKTRYSFLGSLSHFLVAFFYQPPMKKVTFYVDGFNFYYGLKTEKRVNAEWKKAYWIDLVKLFEQFLGENQVLEKVIYFTASPLNKEKSSRQSAFLNANKLINGDKFEIYKG